LGGERESASRIWGGEKGFWKGRKKESVPSGKKKIKSHWGLEMRGVVANEGGRFVVATGGQRRGWLATYILKRDSQKGSLQGRGNGFFFTKE